MSHLRRGANFALALLLSIVAVVPHQHDGLAETLFQERTTQVGTCDAPQTRQHLHASRIAHTQPCVACLRQHSSGAVHVLVAAVERPVVVRAQTVAVAPEPAPSIVFTPLRAPPA
ncbi:MAG TPA: hypothetical protein VHL59_17565 [Thermoanaerobaculia bacterium]|nr:hypothetical protein [Thermoanaerobaculia bacterium]